MKTAAQLREQFSDENFAEFVELLDAAAALVVARDDFDPPAAPDDNADTQEWIDHAEMLTEFADKIDDNLVDAEAAVQNVARLAESVRRNFGF